MKVFIGFVLACFMLAILLRKHDLKITTWLVFGLVLLVSIGYFFFNQI